MIIMDMPFEDGNVPDFGSINMVEVKQYNVRNYTLLSADKNKLNKITNAGSGSLAYCTDSQELLMYNGANKIWYEV